MNYTRDAAGNVLTMTYPSGRIVTYSRDAAGRISSISTKQNSGAAVVTVASALTWQPFGGIASIAFGNGVTATYTSDTDYRITGINVYSTAMGTVLNRTYSWTGDFLMSVTDGVTPTLSQTYTYSPAGRLLTASSGWWGNLSWTYDASGNRTSDTWNGYLTNYSVAATSNRLTSTTAGGQTRAFTHDAAGNMLTDSRSGTAGLSFDWDQEGRLLKSFKTSTTADASNFLYDARFRLASRNLTSAANPTGTFTGFIHDLNNRIIAETDAAGNTQNFD